MTGVQTCALPIYGYPSELFKLDMERLGIATKRKPAKVIDIAQYIENNRGTND